MARYTVRVQYLGSDGSSSLPTRTRTKTFRMGGVRTPREAGRRALEQFRVWTIDRDLYPVLGWHLVVTDRGRPVALASGDAEDFRRCRIEWKRLERP